MKINQLIGDNRMFANIKAVNDLNTLENKEVKSISFMDTLKEKLDEVNDKQLEAESATEAFVKGENVDIHQVMLATEEAKLSLQMAVQVRNKLVEAYQVLNRMQL